MEKREISKIFKYPMPVQEKFELQLPVGAKIIRVADIDGLFYLWAIVNTEIEETETRFIECYKTGQPIDNPETLNYLGLCCLFIMQELGLYMFERVTITEPYTS